MSSVAVLTQESFAEHRSGLAQQQVKGEKRAEFPSCAFKHKRGSLLLPKLTPGIQFTRCAEITFFIPSLVAHHILWPSTNGSTEVMLHGTEPGGGKLQISTEL